MNTATTTFEPEHLERWSADGPTGWDSAANYAGEDLSDFYVAPAGINRDTSDALALSNWRVLWRELEPLLQHECSGIHRFGHWACGWYELILIHESESAALQVADESAAALADYPVLDESDLSAAEHEAEEEAWENWALSDWRDHVSRRLDDLLPEDSNVDGSDLAWDLSSDTLADLWRLAADRLSWSVEHHGDGLYFNFDAGAAELTAAELSAATGRTLLAVNQQWRTEPYPWPGADAAPLEQEATQ